MSADVDIVELTNRDDLRDAARTMARADWLAFDLETRSDRGGLEDWHPSSRIVSAAFADRPDRAWTIPLSHPDGPWSDRWRDVLAWLLRLLRGGPKLVGHNVKFDLRWPATTCGVDLSAQAAWDTQLAAHLDDENQSHGLKQRAYLDLGVVRWDDVDLADAETADLQKLLRYNALDAAYTFRLHLWQRDRLRSQPKLGRLLWHVSMPALRALVPIETTGMLLDVDETHRRHDQAKTELDQLYLQFEQQVPDDLRAQHQPIHARLFDMGPPTKKERLSLAATSTFFRQYAEQTWPVLERKDDTGAPSWDASVLKRLAKRGFEDAQTLLKYRKLDKQISTYLSKWPNDVDQHGRLHPTFKLASVDTGRTSCERPNLQQVDSRLKTCFVAPSGWWFVQIDQSQIEVRVLAHVSGDRNLKAVYRDGRDVYVTTAAAVYGVDPGAGTKADPGDVDPAMRQRTKPVVLGFQYGMLAPSFVTYARDQFDLTFTEDEAEEIRESFFGLYPGIRAYHERQRRTVRRNKQVVSPHGRIRRLPAIDSPDQRERWSAERQAINAPIQAGASDLMLQSLADVNRHVVDPDTCRLVGTVHDSMLLEIREDVLDETVERVCGLMVEPDLGWSGLALTVPLSVEAEIGRRWGDPERTVEKTGPTLAQAA